MFVEGLYLWVPGKQLPQQRARLLETQTAGGALPQVLVTLRGLKQDGTAVPQTCDLCC